MFVSPPFSHFWTLISGFSSTHRNVRSASLLPVLVKMFIFSSQRKGEKRYDPLYLFPNLCQINNQVFLELSGLRYLIFDRGNVNTDKDKKRVTFVIFCLNCDLSGTTMIYTLKEMKLGTQINKWVSMIYIEHFLE